MIKRTPQTRTKAATYRQTPSKRMAITIFIIGVSALWYVLANIPAIQAE